MSNQGSNLVRFVEIRNGKLILLEKTKAGPPDSDLKFHSIGTAIRRVSLIGSDIDCRPRQC